MESLFDTDAPQLMDYADYIREMPGCQRAVRETRRLYERLFERRLREGFFLAHHWSVYVMADQKDARRRSGWGRCRYCGFLAPRWIGRRFIKHAVGETWWRTDPVCASCAMALDVYRAQRGQCSHVR